MKTAALLLAALLMAPLAQARYFDQEDESMNKLFYQGELRTALYQDFTLDTQKPTHIIVVGSAVKEDSDQFFQSGIARAQKYKELHPDHQVYLMSSPEVRGRDDQEVFDKYNLPVVKLVKETFTPGVFFQEIAMFDKVASIDFYGHSSPWSLKFGKSDAAFDPDAWEPALRTLAKKMMSNSYVTLNGCNSGFNTAPALSKFLGVPVSGALTGSLFELYQSDSHWYKEKDKRDEQFPQFNRHTFMTDLDCKLGLCWRMKPDRANYSSYWGTFKDGGLSFYKFFCNFDNQNSRCEKGMANALMTFPSVTALDSRPSEEDFKKVVFDWLCSTSKDSSYFNRCVEGIQNAVARGDLVYQQHPGNALNCDFRSCNATVVCKKKLFGSGPRGGSCVIKTEVNSRPTTITREYLAFLKGFRALN
ncbi:MAG: hypothetical protein COW00_08610 [Bdellovibrio sp. CG12_big_fil_rev_8_21_14_0_65_39_13]|nr:MAG: hypothetical protein COW78_08680 [Bdellovibrio sp. CG22_combo_CG10-13_8_21_14_all_39_27]PIQ59686.1 MAG: hypothetical protein COW00_08610 [Bdellovibrio sp. CG12_big_fil_rev_8_21_14_0_65_39_13]PIR36283.1 MAG: hypothetical protein COV37_04775 [Bdellovibrio sp. CG11_big_fil_rev_8_21_14_0_20_39_38]PJB53403.1 MAG: hypothetical protein CO099_07310 [Bdellovibrio sp. CG_4_9_14_3_um_filter_39_7]